MGGVAGRENARELGEHGEDERAGLREEDGVGGERRGFCDEGKRGRSPSGPVRGNVREMSARFWAVFSWVALAIAAGVSATAAELALPSRAKDAVTGAEFAVRVSQLDRDGREASVIAEMRKGNVPAWWRKFVEVKLGEATIAVAPDYLCIGSDEDYWLAPLTPGAAQVIADELGCVLPTRKMVDAIWRAAPLKLVPAPIAPSADMVKAPIFTQHNATVRGERMKAEVLREFPWGTLVAGHKKDVVVSARLATSPGKVAIYGWHKSDGAPIQPLYLGHAATWADYSHGVRLVRREMTVAGKATTVAAVLADAAQSGLLSDEGVVAPGARYEARAAMAAARDDETMEELSFASGVRVVINAPRAMDQAKPVRLVLFGAPAGNTIEQTIGRKVGPGDDWHFDIQHIGAQTRWLRERRTDANLVVAYLQAVQRSFVLWKRVQPEHPQRSVEIVEALRKKFPGARLVLTGHSAGGAFTFSYLDGVEKIPDDVERIAFLDSNYAYETAKGHGAKLAEWLAGAESRRLCVLAYQDYVALLNGKTFVSENGGTWGRSQAMLRDLGERMQFVRSEAGKGLQRHVALGGRGEFLLKENPEKAVLHTRQVEWNGFIQGMLSGTAWEGQGYEYLGARVYGDLITEK